MVSMNNISLNSLGYEERKDDFIVKYKRDNDDEIKLITFNLDDNTVTFSSGVKSGNVLIPSSTSLNI